MSELQDNVLDDQNSDYTDLESLLEVANSAEFSVSDGFTQEKQEFEKLNSFFEIVASNEIQNLGNEDEVFAEERESEISGLQIGSEADEDDGLEISDPQIGSAADKDFSNALGVETQLTEEEQLIYDKGYKEALEEFEKAMSLEKSSLKDLTETMFSIGDDFQERLEALIKTKICELHNDLLESEIQDFSTPFLSKIKQVAGDIMSEIKDVRLELNHADLEFLKGSDVVESLGFEVMERSDLRRGEFRLISNSTGFQRELSH